ncbi:MAG: hypothetical protein R3E79_24200 [Caldilineaceae bacterium]
MTPLNNAVHLFQSSINGLVDNRTALPYANAGFNALSGGDLDNDGYDDLAALRGAGYITNTVVVYRQEQGHSQSAQPSRRRLLAICHTV